MTLKKTTHDSETPAHGQQVISACAFIWHNFNGVKKLFLAKRADTKKFLPGLLELPGGHMDFGEDLTTGLKREIKEEFDMTLRVGDPFAAFTYENKIKGSHTVEVIYFAQFVQPLDEITLNPEDHSEYKWLTVEEITNRKDEIVADIHVTYTHEDDPEYLTMLKGFELLGGGALNF